MRKIFSGKRKKASFSIEASILVPVFLWLFLFLIYMGFYMYNRAVCTYACYTGSRIMAGGVSKGAEGRDAQTVFEEQRQQLQKQLIAAQNADMTVEQAGEKYTVTAKAEMVIPFVGKHLSIRERQWQYRLDPRSYVLRVSLLFQRLVGDDLE